MERNHPVVLTYLLSTFSAYKDDLCPAAVPYNSFSYEAVFIWLYAGSWVTQSTVLKTNCELVGKREPCSDEISCLSGSGSLCTFTKWREYELWDYIKKYINNLWHLQMQYLCVFTARVKDKGFYLKMTKWTFCRTRCTDNL